MEGRIYHDCNGRSRVPSVVPNDSIRLVRDAFYYWTVVVAVAVETALDDHFLANTVEVRIVLVNGHVVTSD